VRRHRASLVLAGLCLQWVWIAGVVGCGSSSTEAWQSRCVAAFRQGESLLKECEATAPTIEDRCRMSLERAGLRRREGTDKYVEALGELKGAGCGDLGARAEFLQGEALLDAGRTLAGLDALRGAILGHPDSVAAGEAVKAVSRERVVAAAKGVSTVKLFLSLYEQVKRHRVAGHLLYFTARDILAVRSESRRRALYLLLLVIDHHPESALWDESVWLAADLLKELGRVSDEARLLEDALLPNRARGMDSLLDGFAQKVRLRLARIYVRQGRNEDALRQLDWVVNLHGQQSLKDDGLWLASKVRGMQGDLVGERRALEFLVENCPWSRHVESAKRRLEEMK